MLSTYSNKEREHISFHKMFTHVLVLIPCEPDFVDYHPSNAAVKRGEIYTQFNSP